MDPNTNPIVIGGKMHKTRWLQHNYIRCFAFNLKTLGQLKGQDIHIFQDDNANFKKPYRFNEVETTQLLIVKFGKTI